ncbi:hypothetical protein SRABI118_03158 [Massilia sp. Bi118]|uniref:hypothetical protein n=1 Tax=Massilia sp. Bi118 TaxID=2822346 RepID=UPI001DC25343|nr:hypothetical protein [Massilia sp. Bi118]CAH0258750.1 hypothetical protein SRABI118_03158 [Massilia sp. Bi118]
MNELSWKKTFDSRAVEQGKQTKWQVHPHLPTCLPNHGFQLGQPNSLILSLGLRRIVLSIEFANDLVIVAAAIGSRATADEYYAEVQSVNGIQPIGVIRVEESPTPVSVITSNKYKSPFSILILANPTLRSPDRLSRRDPIFLDHEKYSTSVIDILRSLLFATEDILRNAASSEKLRIAIFPAMSETDSSTPLVEEVMPNIARPLQHEISQYCLKLGLQMDVVLVLHGSLDYTRASAQFTVDGKQGRSTSFRLDGKTFRHQSSTELPGAATISYFSFDISHTPLHELGHAASELSNGQIIDLYNDNINSRGMKINKKQGRPIPAFFGNYNGEKYRSDPVRSQIGYPAEWQTFHPELRDQMEPNLMDDYWLAKKDPLECQFDKLTYKWLAERIDAKTE